MEQHLEDILETDECVLGEIYVITNLETNMQYVGQTLTHRLNHGKYRPFGSNGRFKDHVSEAMCNTKPKQCRYLNNAIRKYGVENFQVKLLERCNKQMLDEREQFYIQQLHTLYPNGYNLTKGGKTLYVAPYENEEQQASPSKPSRTHAKSIETRQLMSQRLKQVFNDASIRQKREQDAQQQHLQKKLQTFDGVPIDEDIEKYLIPVFYKNTQQVHFYKVVIDGNTTRFRGSNIDDVKKRALDFLQTLYEKYTLATPPNCSGKP